MNVTTVDSLCMSPEFVMQFRPVRGSDLLGIKRILLAKFRLSSHLPLFCIERSWIIRLTIFSIAPFPFLFLRVLSFARTLHSGVSK